MQETFHLQVEDGEALLSGLEEKLVSDDGSFLHPSHRENAFVVCAGPDAAAYMESELRKNGEKPLSGVGLLVLYSNAVTVFQSASREVIEKHQTLLLPLLQAPGVSVLDEYGQDRTGEFTRNMQLLFG
ncbi:MAG: hypothetical protein JKY56_22815 [Kofleriaceae bacterium]|nr:hypothetical protein [Kofleriaceae bacterium]